MDKSQEILNPNMQSISPQMMVIQGVVQNLPEIMVAFQEIYKLNKKEKLFSQILQSRLEELNINKENFSVLVSSLTDLSKTENADEETKTMYRDMIKILFESFANNMHSSRDVSSFLNEL